MFNFFCVKFSEETLVNNINHFKGHENNPYNYNFRDDLSYTSKNWNGFAGTKNSKFPNFPESDIKKDRNVKAVSSNGNEKTTSYRQNRKGKQNLL